MRRAWMVAAVVATTACGRIGFDGLAATDAPDVAGDAVIPVVPGKVQLGQGGDARKVIAPEGSLTRLYVLFGDNHLMTSADGGVTFTECGRLPGYIVELDGTATGNVFAAGTTGVYESNDRCASFVNAGLTQYTGSIAVEPSGNLLVGMGGGLRRRTGTTWAPVASPFTGRLVSSLAVGPSLYVAGSSGGVMRSTDGVSWMLANTGLQSLEIRRIRIVPGRVYLTTVDGVHVSTDGAMSWTPIDADFSDALAADPGDPLFVAHWLHTSLRTSDDGGSSWSVDRRPPEMARSRVNDILFDPLGSGSVIMATGRGLFSAPDHNLALTQFGNVDAWNVWSIASTAAGTRFYATTSGVLRDQSSGLTLRDPGGGDHTATYRVITALDGTTIYVTGRALVSSSDNGDTFTRVYTPVLADSYLTIDVDRTASRLYVSTDARIGQSPDGSTFVFRALAAQWTTDVEVSADGSAVLVATDVGVFASTDDGATYGLMAGLSLDTYCIVQLADGSFLAGTQQGIYRAVTAGSAWSVHGLVGLPVTALSQVGATVVAGADDRVWTSNDGGKNFTQLTGFNGHSPQAFALDAQGSLLIGTSGFGLHRVDLP